jgi:ADP-ribose pyrophosphatase YjhB (NUDIX family)
VKMYPYDAHLGYDTQKASRAKAVRQAAEENDLLLNEQDCGLEELKKSELLEELGAELELEELKKSCEGLEKGAMQRLYPFDPQKEANRETGKVAGVQTRFTMGQDLDSWTGEENHPARVRISEFVSPEATQRSLHKLHSLTQVRRGPYGREFLLHRGHLAVGNNAITDSTHYHSSQPTSWTPNREIANNIFGPSSDQNRITTSAWIPEQHIKTYIPQMGNWDVPTKRAPSTWKREQEVIVGPGKFELHQPGLAKSEEEIESPRKVALAIITDGNGKMCFIKRKDNGKWSLPGGHIEEGEDTETAIRREVLEETGLKPEYFSAVYHKGLPFIVCFSAQAQGNPTNRDDPDQEGKAQWVSIVHGIPSNIWDGLAGPDDETNLVRQLFSQEMGLKKSEFEWLDECGFLDLSK